VCMCERCWDECTEDMKHVVRHRNNFHKSCPKEFPASEVRPAARRTAALRPLTAMRAQLSCGGSAPWMQRRAHLTSLVRHCRGRDLQRALWSRVQLRRLPDSSADSHSRCRAEWRHSHGDHELCRPHYLRGCTKVEALQSQQLHAHRQGECHCPQRMQRVCGS